MSAESVCSVLSLLLFVVVSVPPGVLTTPLDDYVNKPDPHYSYHEVLEWRLKGPGYTMYLLNMTSQQWLTEEEVSRPIWWHFLTVTIPDNITHPDAAFMFIEGGRNDRKHGRYNQQRNVPSFYYLHEEGMFLVSSVCFVWTA
ncbi:autocrine proliferation repressor protein A-like [Branchiostoma floridae]|uniref:Autocrine proliferation repressor protein A-like n=1 Tax=Branchiostoma floridae TaxID=7739 RepID=A0A9J7LQ97_BRAFL|nr:autocrine proliferation repressor protein A-like [Branchiostoma floridae]